MRVDMNSEDRYLVKLGSSMHNQGLVNFMGIYDTAVGTNYHEATTTAI